MIPCWSQAPSNGRLSDVLVHRCTARPAQEIRGASRAHRRSARTACDATPCPAPRDVDDTDASGFPAATMTGRAHRLPGQAQRPGVRCRHARAPKARSSPGARAASTGASSRFSQERRPACPRRPRRLVSPRATSGRSTTVAQAREPRRGTPRRGSR